MTHHRQWSAAFASYFAIMGLWTAFGPGALMASSPRAAPLALAAMTLAYFVATPFVRAVWNALGFSRTIVLMGSGVGLSLCVAAVAPQWLAVCAPLALFFGSGSYTLCETKMLEDLAHAGRSHAFGRARKWGSFGFLAAASLGGAVLTVGGLGPSFTLALGLCGLAYLGFCLALARAVGQAQAGLPTAMDAAPPPDSAPNHVATGHTMPPPSSARRKWMGAGAIAGMRLALAVSTTWFGAFWLSTGHSPLQTGLLCGLPVAAEFWAMWRGGDLLARYSAQAMMLLCCAVSALRWLATPFCDALWCAVPLQSVHAFTFGFFYPASLIWLKQAYPQSFFRARYLTESLARALTATVSFAAASWVIAQWGYGALFGTSCALAAFTGLWWWRVLRS
jgi:hypothetical protein